MNTPAKEKKEYPLLWWGKDELRHFNGKPVDNCNLPYICRHTQYDPYHESLDQSKYNESPLIFVSIYQADDSISAFNKPEDLPPLKDVDAGKKAWVLYGWEPPMWFERKKSVISKFTYKFNYHPSSDFVYPYFDSNIFDTVLALPPVTLEYKKTMRKQGFNGGKGLAPIAWIVSNCHASSGREYYVRQLQKYVDIDIYGHCSYRNREWPTHADSSLLTDLEISSSYRFYLAFENSNCDFYVTEKLKRTYEAATIPIVDGPNDYGPFAATHNALIRADEYSPKQLAALVKELDENDEKYLERLRYKYPKDSTHKPTVNDLSPMFVSRWTQRNQSADFLSYPPVYDESMCRACMLAHDVSEGIVKLDPTKRLAPDVNCLQKKHFHFTWMVEYHWRLVLLILAIIATASLMLYRNRRTWAPRVKAKLLRRWYSSKIYIALPTFTNDPNVKIVCRGGSK
ncbi:Alpha-(1,3)-fucosyltransferase 11 [Mortierella sp. GBA30]|nr:Alpha-(1,3)-fucosyltransferase 11 [Mortierella sp. GBA30]